MRTKTLAGLATAFLTLGVVAAAPATAAPGCPAPNATSSAQAHAGTATGCNPGGPGTPSNPTYTSPYYGTGAACESAKEADPNYGDPAYFFRPAQGCFSSASGYYYSKRYVG